MKNQEKTVSGLSKVERLKIANQYRILEKLSKGREAKHFSVLASIFEHGYVHLYGQAVERVWDEMPDEDSKEVIDILELYRVLLLSLKKLPPADQEKLQKEVKFKGFDGNEETGHYLFAQFFCEELDRYNELEVINSHNPTLDDYRAQLKKWDRFGRRIKLTKEEIESIAQDGPIAF